MTGGRFIRLYELIRPVSIVTLCCRGVGDYSELCHVPMDILGAAELMRQRLHHFIIEANPFTVGNIQTYSHIL